jgi:Zn ribbon nucleic-acid-binding protein
MRMTCAKCHRETSHNTWTFNQQNYQECGRCGTATPTMPDGRVSMEGVNQ